MTDLDWIPGEADATRPERAPRRHRHVWEGDRGRFVDVPNHPGRKVWEWATWACVRCGAPRDATATRRGRSARRLGNDQERRAERVYGLQKIGERGEITDLRGTIWKVQQKATRRAVPMTWESIFRQLDATNDGREAAILFSFVRHGVPTADYWLVRGNTILALLGRDEPPKDGQ